MAVAISVRTFLWARSARPQKCPCLNCCGYSYTKNGVADWWDEFVRGGYAATHKFIPGLSNTRKTLDTGLVILLHFLGNNHWKL
jgi:hypothetical protein